MRAGCNRAGKLRNRITIQKNVTRADNIGNHIAEWREFYSCAAYANKASGKEYSAIGQTLTDETVIFEIRWCKKLRDMDSATFRILFQDAIYNIISVDDVQYRHEGIKIIAERERGEPGGQEQLDHWR